MAIQTLSGARVHPTSTEVKREVPPCDTVDLVRRSQNGDTSAYESLYRAHVQQIHALCLRLSGDPGRATELTQDVFVRVWQTIGSFRGEAAFATWLYRLAFNVVRQSQRSEARRASRIESREQLDDIAAGRCPRAEDRIDLERAIARLPNRARNALVLHDIHGFKCREIAEITGTAVGTIQAHLHRARKLLQEMLDR